ncbi:MAG: hypothetical protein IIU58_05050 [Clostridia bacterium]|nr:hypothetical protein [Clostridia bacterium]
MDKIISTLALDALLIQLAEECGELTQAVCKYYRATHDDNPTPLTLADALDRLVEEIADVNVAAEAVRMKLGICCEQIAEAEDAKIERWRRWVSDAPRTTDRN